MGGEMIRLEIGGSWSAIGAGSGRENGRESGRESGRGRSGRGRRAMRGGMPWRGLCGEIC